MIEVTVLLSILNQIDCHHDHSPLNLKGNIVISVQFLHVQVEGPSKRPYQHALDLPK